MNNITIELCAEDRARLDRINEVCEAITIQLLALLEKETKPKLVITKLNPGDPGYTPHPKDDELTEALKRVVEQTTEKDVETAQDEPKAIDHPTLDPFPETPTEAKEGPQVTLAQIQQKVVQLAAGFGGAKKAAVRDIINAHAKKVSDLPEDKWGEVWLQLTALEEV